MPREYFSSGNKPWNGSLNWRLNNRYKISRSCINDVKLISQDTRNWLTIVTFVLIREWITKAHQVCFLLNWAFPLWIRKINGQFVDAVGMQDLGSGIRGGLCYLAGTIVSGFGSEVNAAINGSIWKHRCCFIPLAWDWRQYICKEHREMRLFNDAQGPKLSALKMKNKCVTLRVYIAAEMGFMSQWRGDDIQLSSDHQPQWQAGATHVLHVSLLTTALPHWLRARIRNLRCATTDKHTQLLTWF